MLQNFKTEIKLFFLVVLVAVVISVCGILLLRALRTPPATVSSDLIIEDVSSPRSNQELTSADDQNQVIAYLKENITNIVQAEPVLGAYRFFVFDTVEFYEGNKFIAPFEDGHIGGYLLGKYSIENGEVKIVYLDEILNQETLDGLKKRHGFIDIDTSNWQTYRSDEFGFEFKYPEDYETKEIPIDKPTGLSISLDKGSITVQEIDNSIININVPEDCMFNSGTLEEKNMLSFVDTKKVNGINFYYYKNYPEYIGGYCGMSAGCWYKDIYRTLHNGQCHQIVYDRSDRSFIEGNPYNNPIIIGDVKEIPKLFDQILSTFRFVE